MIRCLVCGFNNQQSAKKCEKCHNYLSDNSLTGVHKKDSLLQSNNETKLDVSRSEKIDKTIIDISATGDVHLRKTLNDKDFEMTHNDSENTKCNKCGYPLRPKEIVCPNCGTEQNETFKSKESGKVDEGINALKHPNLAKTSSIDSFEFIQKDVPRFKLSIFKGKKSTVFEGLSVVLNRNNTDTNNANISKEAHAIVENKDNKWVLKDVSSNGATFVQVTKPTEIKDQDLIIIGNIIYRFELLNNDE